MRFPIPTKRLLNPPPPPSFLLYAWNSRTSKRIVSKLDIGDFNNIIHFFAILGLKSDKNLTLYMKYKCFWLPVELISLNTYQNEKYLVEKV
jgi:hypothetical protein